MPESTRQFAVRRDEAGTQQHTIAIRDTSGKAADVGLYTWAASLALANELWHLGPGVVLPSDSSETPTSPSTTSGRTTLLELGAGTGLVGLAAALLWRADALLTDVRPVVPNLAANIALNKSALDDAGVRVSAGELDWEAPGTVVLHDSSSDAATPAASVRPREVQVIMAADVVYSEELPAQLVDVVSTWLARNAGARFVLAYPLRVFQLDIIRDLWARLEGLGLTCFREGRGEADESFDDEKVLEWCVWRWA